MHTLRESRPPAPGQQHTYSIDPPLQPGCEIVWYINGQPASLWSKIGGLEAKGFGSAGTMTVEVNGDVSSTTVHAVVRCPGQAPAPAGPMVVGAGKWDPCAEEPCRSARANYQAKIRAARAASALVKRWCATARMWAAFLILLLVTMVLVMLAVVMCETLHWPAIACTALYTTLAVLAATFAAAEVYYASIRLSMLQSQLDCTQAKIAMLDAYGKMLADCPNAGCWPPLETIDCEC